MNSELSAEKRAHDFACAVLSNEFLIKAQIKFAESVDGENVVDLMEIYNKTYEFALSIFKK